MAQSPRPILSMEIRYEYDVVLCRQRSRSIAGLLGCDVNEQTRIATAVSELARNTFRFAGRGRIQFSISLDLVPEFIVSIEDNGPGIADLEAILAPGEHEHTYGILGAKRLMDTFAIQTSSAGTRVVIGKILHHRLTPFGHADLALLTHELLRLKPLEPLEELRRQNRELLETLETLRNQQKELQEAKEEATRANQSKSAFLANMSHEIRTPLAAILGFTELLQEPDLSEEDRSKFVHVIKSNGSDLAHLIDDILDLSKVEAGHMEIDRHWLDLVRLIDDIDDLLGPKARSKGLSMRYVAEGVMPARLRTDGARLRQILINIVGNAIKFTEQGEVLVRVRMATRDLLESGESQVEILVGDSGVGISEAEAGRLFQPFSQADSSTTRRFGGTGLGLTLSRHLATLLGGTVALVCSTPGQGSTFLIRIEAGRSDELAAVPPLSLLRRPQSAAEFSEPEARGRPLDGLRVLVAEDAADNRFWVKRLLTNCGARVDMVGNGAEAIKQALKVVYDVVLMDIQMPVLDGYRATQLLRERHYLPPIIALTAHAMHDERERCLAVGCNDHITKPIDRRQLVRTISAHLRRPGGAVLA